MSPYEILGIRSTATLDEAEAAYRARLREWHPDVHTGDGPDALARAEQRTRELNDAMRTLRTMPPDPPRLRCVFCGVRVREPGDYRAHVLLDHAFVDQQRRAGSRPPRLSGVPAPMFWSLIVVICYWAMVFAVFGDSTPAIAGWWVGVLAYLAVLPTAYRAERHRRRY